MVRTIAIEANTSSVPLRTQGDTKLDEETHPCQDRLWYPSRCRFHPSHRNQIWLCSYTEQVPRAWARNTLPSFSLLLRARAALSGCFIQFIWLCPPQQPRREHI